jgi:hypothetical protein
MFLPYSMLLLGGFDNKQVPHTNVEKAQAVLTDYVVKNHIHEISMSIYYSRNPTFTR